MLCSHRRRSLEEETTGSAHTAAQGPAWYSAPHPWPPQPPSKASLSRCQGWRPGSTLRMRAAQTDTRSPMRALLLTQTIPRHGAVLPDTGATYCVGMLAMVVRPKWVGLCPAGEEDKQEVTGSQCTMYLRACRANGASGPPSPLLSSHLPRTAASPATLQLAAFSSALQMTEGSFCPLSPQHCACATLPSHPKTRVHLPRRSPEKLTGRMTATDSTQTSISSTRRCRWKER